MQDHEARIAVLETQQEHVRGMVTDHEDRLRPLENFKAQVLAYAAMGAILGGAFVQLLSRMVKA